MASYFQYIVPEATTNLLSDPAFDLADPDTEWTFAGDGAQDYTRDTSQQFYGSGCALTDFGGGTYTDIYQSVTVTATAYYLSARVKRTGSGTVSATETQAYFDSSNVAWDSITALRDNWYLCEYTATATAGARTFGVRSLEDDLWVDAVQLENKSYRTTFCYGNREGCQWTGTPYQSTSTRSAQAKGGGRLYDIEDRSAYAQRWTGMGMPKVRHHTRGYALLPGSYHMGTKIEERMIQILLWLKGTSLSNLHSVRQQLVEDWSVSGVLGTQPVRWRYSGATVEKEFDAYYESGLELHEFGGYKENVPLRLLCPDPLFYQVGETSTALDVSDTVAVRDVVGRLDGTWDALGPPSSGGTVYCMSVGPDGYLYVGGDFTNWDGGANLDGICYYDGSTWTAMGTGADDNIVYDMCWDANGNLYAVGTFTGMGGVANTLGVAQWDGTSWNALGTGLDDNGGYGCCADMVGHIIVGGSFTGAGGVANTPRCAYWDGSAWQSIGSDIDNGTVWCVEADLENTIWIGGNFTNVVDANGDYLIRYTKGATTPDIESSTTYQANGIVYTLARGPERVVRKLASSLGLLSRMRGTYYRYVTFPTLYIGGAFTTIGGVSCARIADWDGTRMRALGDGADDDVRDIEVGPDNKVYIVGELTTFDSRVLNQPAAVWKGSEAHHLDIDLPAGFDATYLYAVALDQPDPVNVQNYDIYLGGGGDGNATVAGSATITNDGSMTVAPIVRFNRSGGTSATVHFVRDETSGAELPLDYDLADGETLTVDFANARIYSDMYGARMQSITRSGDFAGFRLEPGDSTVTAFVTNSGATITAYLLFKEAFWSAD